MKKIAITQRITRDQRDVYHDSLEHDYIKYFSQHDILLIPVPNCLTNISEWEENIKIDGVILAGGGDITGTEQGYRNTTEKYLFDYCVKMKLPILGICRGSQQINNFLGGTLIQNLNLHNDSYHNHTNVRHELIILDNRLLPSKGKISVKKHEVNSYHNHGFTKLELAPQLRVLAESSDGTVEAFISLQHPILGIMWHPERELEDSEINQYLVRQFKINFVNISN